MSRLHRKAIVISFYFMGKYLSNSYINLCMHFSRLQLPGCPLKFDMIVYESIAGRYRPVRVADGPITARFRFINNASWV